jgi:hypothetical protein
VTRTEEIANFIRSSFRSIWSLELLLFLKEQPWQAFAAEELVSQLRASNAIVSSSVASLLAAGLIVEESGGAVRYSPASEDLGRLVGDTEALYRVQPDAVRRVIVIGTDNLAAFAEAFRLRKD